QGSTGSGAVMMSRRVVHIGTAVIAAVLIAQTVGASVWLVSQPSPTSANPLLAQVHDVAGEFPSGYEVVPTKRAVVTQDYLNALNAPMAGATYIPAECGDGAGSASMMPVGSTMEGLRGQKGDQMITVAAMETPAPLGVSPVPPQCAGVAFFKL